MSLNLAAPEQRSPLKSILIAAAVMIAIAAAIFLFLPRRPAEISVAKVQVFAPHTDFKAMAGSTHIVGQAAQSQDDLYVVVTIKVTDKLRLPLFLAPPEATLTIPAGEADAAAISPRYIPQLETVFPALTPLIVNPLADGDEVAPGATREASVLFLFPGLKEEDWKSKQAATLTVKFAHQEPQTISLK
jgi:hypothetical protein